LGGRESGGHAKKKKNETGVDFRGGPCQLEGGKKKETFQRENMATKNVDIEWVCQWVPFQKEIKKNYAK